MNAQKVQLASLVAVFVLAAAVLTALLVWQRQTPNGRPHEIFGRHEYLRIALPAPAMMSSADADANEEADVALAPAEETEDAEAPETADEAPPAAGDAAEATAAVSPRRASPPASFAERFGTASKEVRNPTWLDLTFDLAQAGRSQTGVTVAKPVNYKGSTLGAIQLDFGGGSTVLVDPKELIALLERSSVDTSRLQQLASRDKVAFADLRAAGIDLRYRPAQDQLALEVAGDP